MVTAVAFSVRQVNVVNRPRVTVSGLAVKLVITGLAGGLTGGAVGATFEEPSPFTGADGAVPVPSAEAAEMGMLEGWDEWAPITLFIPPQPARTTRQKGTKAVQIPGPCRKKHLKYHRRLAAG